MTLHEKNRDIKIFKIFTVINAFKHRWMKSSLVQLKQRQGFIYCLVDDCSCTLFNLDYIAL